MKRHKERYEKLQEYLDREGLSQTDFAKKAGVLPSQVNNYLTGKRKPRRNVAVRLWQACEEKVALRDLLNGDAFGDYI